MLQGHSKIVKSLPHFSTRFVYFGITYTCNDLLSPHSGYLSPEYAMRGHLTEKTDVFAFGVVALEVVSGRPNSDSSLEEEQVYLLEWV